MGCHGLQGPGGEPGKQGPPGKKGDDGDQAGVRILVRSVRILRRK